MADTNRLKGGVKMFPACGPPLAFRHGDETVTAMNIRSVHQVTPGMFP